jgi:hypothetical protein
VPRTANKLRAKQLLLTSGTWRFELQRYEILVFCPRSVIYAALNVKLNAVLTCK